MSQPSKAAPQQLSLWDRESLESMRAPGDSWRQRYDAEAARAVPGRVAPGHASAATELQALHTPADLEGWSFNDVLGFPGEYPLTRGIYSSI